MTTQLSAKLAAFALALSLNIMMIGGIAYLFGPQMNHRLIAATATGSATGATAGGANAQA